MTYSLVYISCNLSNVTWTPPLGYDIYMFILLWLLTYIYYQMLWDFFSSFIINYLLSINYPSFWVSILFCITRPVGCVCVCVVYCCCVMTEPVTWSSLHDFLLSRYYSKVLFPVRKSRAEHLYLGSFLPVVFGFSLLFFFVTQPPMKKKF